MDWTDDPDSRVNVAGHGAGRPARHPAAGRRPPAGPVRRRRRGQHGRLRADLPGPAPRAGGAVGERDQHAGHRGRQHGRQPAGHVRDLRAAARWCGTSSAACSRSPPGLALTSGALAVLHCDHAAAGRGPRSWRCCSSPAWPPRWPGSGCTAAGSSAGAPGDRGHRRAGPGWPAGAAQLTRPRRARRAGRGPRWPGCWPLTALLYLAGLSRNGWANDFYAAAVQAGSTELEGLLLRLVRRLELHHRRQDPGLAVGHGAVGAGVRAELLERAGAAGAGGGRLGGAAVRGGAPLVRARRRAAGRGGAGADPGGRADVPVQQPGRAAGAADDRRPRTRRSGPSSRGGPGGWCWPGRCSASGS